MSAQIERPPTSGKGSSVEAWREYAAAVTDSPAESWESLSREEIVELLDSEGVDQAAEDEQHAPEEGKPRRRQRPQWMVPTADGMVPEHEFRRR